MHGKSSFHPAEFYESIYISMLNFSIWTYKLDHLNIRNPAPIDHVIRLQMGCYHKSVRKKMRVNEKNCLNE